MHCCVFVLGALPWYGYRRCTRRYMNLFAKPRRAHHLIICDTTDHFIAVLDDILTDEGFMLLWQKAACTLEKLGKSPLKHGPLKKNCQGFTVLP